MAIFALTTEHGPHWDASRGIREQDAWAEHAAFMNGLVDEGFILVGGPLGDGQHTLHMIEAGDEREVEARMGADPWAARGLLRIGALQRWSIWLGSPASRVAPVTGPSAITIRRTSVLTDRGSCAPRLFAARLLGSAVLRGAVLWRTFFKHGSSRDVLRSTVLRGTVCGHSVTGEAGATPCRQTFRAARQSGAPPAIRPRDARRGPGRRALATSGPAGLPLARGGTGGAAEWGGGMVFVAENFGFYSGSHR